MTVVTFDQEARHRLLVELGRDLDEMPIDPKDLVATDVYGVKDNPDVNDLVEAGAQAHDSHELAALAKTLGEAGMNDVSLPIAS